MTWFKHPNLLYSEVAKREILAAAQVRADKGDDLIFHLIGLMSDVEIGATERGRLEERIEELEDALEATNRTINNFRDGIDDLKNL